MSRLRLEENLRARRRAGELWLGAEVLFFEAALIVFVDPRHAADSYWTFALATFEIPLKLFAASQLFRTKE